MKTTHTSTTIRTVCALVFLLGACGGTHASAQPASTSTTAERTTERWRVDTPGALRALATDDDGTIVTTDDHVVALGPDGATRWSVPLADVGVAYPASGRGLVAVGTETQFVMLDR